MMLAPKPKSSVAFTCLLDLLFVLIFAALLKVDPTGVEKIEVTGSRMFKELKDTTYQLKVRLKSLQKQNNDLLIMVKSSDREIESARRKMEAKIKATTSALEKTKQENKRLKSKAEQLASALSVPPLNGLWEGKGCQNYRGQCWSIKVLMPKLYDYPNTSALPLIRMTYPSLGCKATWHFIENVRGELRFRERITSGSCIDNGIVKITAKVDGTLNFEFKKGRHLAFGTLSRSAT